MKGGSLSFTSRGRTACFTAGNKGEEVGRFRFLKVGGGEKIETRNRDISAIRLKTNSSVEEKTILVSRTLTVKGWSEHNVGLKYTRSVGKDANLICFSENREVVNKKIELIGGGLAATAGPGVLASDIKIVTAGNTIESLLIGNRDIIFLNPLNRLRVGYSSVAGVATAGMLPLAGAPLFNETYGASLLSPLGAPGAHYFNALVKGSFIQSLVLTLGALAVEFGSLAVNLPLGSPQFLAIQTTLTTFAGILQSDLLAYPASFYTTNSIEAI